MMLGSDLICNEYHAEAAEKRGVFGVSDHTAILANQAAMNKQLETLTKEFHGFTMANKQQQVAAIRCDLCGEGHANGECVPEGCSEEANYVGNYQMPNPYYNPGFNKHPNLSYSNKTTLNPLLPNPQQKQLRKPSALEETMINFMKMTQGNFEEIKKSQEAERKNNETSRKMFETQIGQMAKKIAKQNKGGFSGNTKENPKNESCNAIELRSKKVLTPLVPRVQKKVEEVVVEVDNNGEVENNVEVLVENESDHGVVENERKKKIEGEKSEKLIDADSILRKSKSELLKDGDKPQVIPSYVKLPYPHLAKKKKKEEGQFKKFMELFSQLHVNIPFKEALDQMFVYAKFMKELLTGRKKPKDDENIALSENCSAILQKKLPPKLKDLGVFTIPCSIGKVDIGKPLCDLGASVNLLPLSMMNKIGYGEPKPTRMTLALADRSISYPFGVLEDVLVKVNELVFLADFVILDMVEDEDMPLILGRHFLATGHALIDVEMGELMLRFQNEQVVFNIFEAMKHRTENPQCYRIDVIEEIVEDNSCEPKPTQPMERAIVNSIKSCENVEDLKVKECIKQLEENERLMEPAKLKAILDEKSLGVQTLSSEGEKNPKLKELPSHLKYVFLSKDASKPAIISSTLTPLKEDKLMRVLRDNQGALGWNISNLKGISPAYCMHKIHMEAEYKPVVQPQRRLNPTMKKVVKKEVLKLLDTCMIYPIFDSSWVSHVHVVPKKGGMAVVANEKK